MTNIRYVSKNITFGLSCDCISYPDHNYHRNISLVPQERKHDGNQLKQNDQLNHQRPAPPERQQAAIGCLAILPEAHHCHHSRGQLS